MQKHFWAYYKKGDTVGIDDEYSSGENLGVPSPQGNMSPIHGDTPDNPNVK